METQEQKSAEYRQFVETYKPQIEEALRENLPLAPIHIETQFNVALEFALFNGGDRICPLLTLLGAELVDGNASEVLPTAIAVEFIWTSSQVFDDLLAKDKRQQSEDKKSLHEMFGESLANLVGLALLNAAYPLVFVNHSGMPERAFAAHSEIVECVGAAGLVGGLAVDTKLVESAGVSDELNSDSIRQTKNSAIMRLAFRIGAILSGTNYMELANLSHFAEMLGDIYQQSDDSLAIDKFPKVEDAKRILVENFPSNDARSCLIQLVESSMEKS